MIFDENNASNNNSLKLLVKRCPTCGDKIKYKQGDKVVTCVSCGNVYKINDFDDDTYSKDPTNDKVKVEGLKTSSSVLAYVDQFFDSYDWDTFAYDPELTLDELEDLTKDLKQTSADDYKTWVVCFIILTTPFIKKLESRQKVFSEIIAEYKNGSLEAYGMYETYKLVTSNILNSYPSIVKQAEQYLNYAIKYQLPSNDLSSLKRILASISIERLNDTILETVEDIPEIKSFLKLQEEDLVKKFENNGINANEYYENGNRLLSEGKYVEAISIFNQILNYKDTNKILDKINNYSLLSDALIYDNIPFGIEKSAYNTFKIHKIVDGQCESVPMIIFRGKIITVYGNYLYYFGDQFHSINAVDLSNGDILFNYKCIFVEHSFYVSNELGKAYFVVLNHYNGNIYYLYELNLKTNEMIKLYTNINSEPSFCDNFVVLTYSNENTITTLLNMRTGESFDINKTNISFAGAFDNKLLFTINLPSEYNLALYAFDIETKEEKLIENNVQGPISIIDNIILYFSIDNIGCRHLISIDKYFSNRKELSSFIESPLFISGCWLYVIKKIGYNTALCKMNLVNKSFKTIASQINEFVKINNGYLYYIDDEFSLRKVRLDGTRNTIICYNVRDILSLNSKNIVYLAQDHDDIMSLYAIDFENGGRRKVSYHVNECIMHDENTIYYCQREEKKYGGIVSTDERLYKLDLKAFEETKISKLLPDVTHRSSGCYVATCVYGSYDCPEVWVLRRFRDYKLNKTIFGKLFIKTYYAVSPTIVKLFGKKTWFNKMWKPVLDKMVIKYKSQGFEDLPYNDLY